MLADIGERLVDARGHVAGRIGQIARAGEHARALRAAQHTRDQHEQFDAAHALGMHHLLHQRRELPAGGGVEQHAAPRRFQNGPERGELRQGFHGTTDEVLGELDDAAAQRNACPRRNIADPVVRQIGPGQHQVARFKLANEIADKITA